MIKKLIKYIVGKIPKSSLPLYIIRHNNNSGYVFQKRKLNGSYFMFNFNQHYKVWRARKKIGLPTTEQIMINDHYLVGQKLCEVKTGKIYNIEKIYEEWYGGWYIKLLIENNKSHGVRSWRNINCFEPITLKNIQKSTNSYELISS